MLIWRRPGGKHATMITQFSSKEGMFWALHFASGIMGISGDRSSLAVSLIGRSSLRLRVSSFQRVSNVRWVQLWTTLPFLDRSSYSRSFVYCNNRRIQNKYWKTTIFWQRSEYNGDINEHPPTPPSLNMYIETLNGTKMLRFAPHLRIVIMIAK